MILLAQADLGNVPAEIFKWVLIILLTLAVAAVGVWSKLRRPAVKTTTIIDDQPVEIRKAPKRYNHDLAESRHGDVTRRLDGHDAEIEQLWMTMRSEDADIRKENGIKFDAILLSLGEIKGQLKNQSRP